MIVAIDGPAGSGKSTVAHAIAERCGFTYLDTGAMYRCVALACLKRGVDPDDTAAVAEVAQNVRIEFGSSDEGQTVILDGVDVTHDLRTPVMDRTASKVSAIPEVRTAMLGLQRAVGAQGDVVAEGRDIGTVVFPDAEVKVFLTADAAARALRRAVQRDGGDAAKDANATADAEKVQAILDDIKRRDQADSSREVAPLRAADDAHHIDSSSLGVEEVIAEVMKLMESAR